MRATTAGVGQLLLAARERGARRIVVGCGGSSTTDGGLGAYQAVGSPEALRGVELVVACDVTTRFGDAAAVFGPQKGATAAQVVSLGQRLVEVAARYRRETGVDVTCVAGGGAAGGLAGGLWPSAPGSSPASTSWPGWSASAPVWSGPTWPSPERDTSIPRRSTARCRGVCSSWPEAPARAKHLPVLCIAGARTGSVLAAPPPGLDVVSLTARFGRAWARAETTRLISLVTAEALSRFCP